MAESKAEDEEDDWGFGDFTFAPHLPNQPTNNEEDDDWGDFVKSPLQSSNVSSNNQSISAEFLNHGAGSEEKNQLGKIKGALPLSLFGEEEEEEEEKVDGVDLSAGDGNDLFSVSNKRSGDLKSGRNLNLGLGINDIIANLYSQNGNQIGGEKNGVNLKLDEVKLNVNEKNLNLGAASFVWALDQSKEVKNENGLFSNNSVSNAPLSFEFDVSNLNSNGTAPVSDGVDLDLNRSVTNLSGLNWTSTIQSSQEVKAENGNSKSNFGDWNMSFTGLDSNEVKIENNNSNSNSKSKSNVPSSNFGGWDLSFTGLDSNVEAPAEEEEVEVDGEDDGWEFKDAYSEPTVENGNKKENIALEFPLFDLQTEAKAGKEMQDLTNVTKSTAEQNVSQDQIDFFAMSNGISGDQSHDMPSLFSSGTGALVENDLFADQYHQTVQKDIQNGPSSHPLAENDYSDDTFGNFNQFGLSNGFSSKPRDLDIGPDIKPGTEIQNGTISDPELQSASTDMKIELKSFPLAENSDLDEDFGDFEDAVPNSGKEQEGNEMKTRNYKGPVPLSIFGIEEPETDVSLDIQDEFMSKAANMGNGHSRAPSLSISDILLDLYSQAEPTATSSMHKTNDVNLGSTNVVSSSDIVDGDDDFEDDSWEFKDAASKSTISNNTSVISTALVGQSLSSESKINTYVEFYGKLKDELCLVSRLHLWRVKKARTAAALSGEDSKLAAFDEEIQDVSKELDQLNILYKIDEDDHLLKEIRLGKFLDILHENKFQALDSEYELSRRLTLAEKDLKSAVELTKHATTMVRILTLISTEEQSSYISTWFKMLSACTQELQHGSWIWKQSLEKNVQKKIISEPRGKQFILALAEIYRVVLVLGASVKLYKPWILSSSVNPTSIYALIEECHSLWSCSRFEEALESISDLNAPVDDASVEALLASIINLRDVNELKLNHVFGQQESLCLLSGLTPGLIPDIKIVVWDGEHYFLTLANLWANLISNDPPKLTRINVG